MKHNSDSKGRTIGLLLTLLFFVATMIVTVIGINTVSATAREQSLAATEQSVRRAVVECYALEGEYPSDMNYLSENYAVSVDKNKYIVIYRLVASNIMPEITVIEKQ